MECAANKHVFPAKRILAPNVAHRWRQGCVPACKKSVRRNRESPFFHAQSSRKFEAAQCLGGEPSNGETAYPRATDVSELSLGTQALELSPNFGDGRSRS